MSEIGYPRKSPCAKAIPSFGSLPPLLASTVDSLECAAVVGTSRQCGIGLSPGGGACHLNEKANVLYQLRLKIGNMKNMICMRKFTCGIKSVNIHEVP